MHPILQKLQYLFAHAQKLFGSLELYEECYKYSVVIAVTAETKLPLPGCHTPDFPEECNLRN